MWVAKEKCVKAFEASPVAIAIFSLESRRLLEVNRAFEELSGHRRHEVVGPGGALEQMWVDTQDRQRALETLVRQRSLRGHELRFRTTSGDELTCGLSAEIIDLSGEECALIFLSDLTSQKRAEEALRRERDLVSRIMETNPVGIVALAPDGSITFANAAAETILGLARDQAAGLAYNALQWRISAFDGEPFPDQELPFSRVVASGKPVYDVRHAIERDDGQRLLLSINAAPLLDEQGQVDGVVATLDDVTQRVRTAQALRDSARRLQDAIDAAPFGAHLYELGDDGRLVFVGANRSADQILGVDHGQFVGKTLEEAFPALAESEIPTAYRRVAAHGERYEADQIDYDEGKIRGAFQVNAFQTGPNRMAVFFRDVTVQKKAEVERAQLESQLAQAQKMELVGRFAGGIAHDFNNLLTAITMHAELGRLATSPGSPAHQALLGVGEAAESAAALTRQLLSVSRRQVIQPTVIDLSMVVARVKAMLRRVIPEDVGITLHTEGAPLLIKADPGQIEQILLNLAVNARDAMSEGGTVAIATRSADLDEAWCLSHLDARPGRYALLRVTDTGSGIPESVREQMFEPFFTTKPVGKGSGLGLAVVYGIVRQNGGFIQVHSEIGSGSTFEVFFPITAEPAEPGRALDDEGAAEGGEETLILVEDESLVREIVSEALSGLGYTVLSCATGEQALEEVARHQGAIHLLLTDVVLPGMSGRELATRLAERRPEIKVLFTSGHAEDVLGPHGVLDSSTHFIGKPYSPESLARKVRDVLGS